MNKKRSISTAIIMVLLLGAVVFAAVMIMRVTSDVSRSRITASNVEIKVLMEETEGQELTSDETTIKPEDTVSRIAKVKNTGDQPAWVRVKTSIVVGGETVAYKDNGYLELKEINSDDWAEGDDGYWYYKEILEPGATSTALFKSIDILDVGTDFDGANLKVDAEGTQSKNNGGSWDEAKGWPQN